MPDPFAMSDDLTDRYPTDFVDDEEGARRADVLLAAASRVIRQRVPGIDERTDLDPDLITDIVCEMVWSAITVSTPGATQQTQSVNGVSVSTTFDGAAGRLRLTRAQLKLLRKRRGGRASSTSNLPATSGVQREPGTEQPYRGGEYPWCRPY